MENDKNFDRLNEAANDSAKRQNEVFDRIQTIVKENPESAKQYLQHLTQTSKWELYSRIYGKFAYITLLIAFLVVGLIVGIKKLSGANEKTILESFVKIKPELKISENKEGKYVISYINPETETEEIIGQVQNFAAESKLAFDKSIAGGWVAFKNKLKIGEFDLSIEQDPFDMNFDNERYQIGTPHKFGKNKDLWFNITHVDSYKPKGTTDTTTRITYLVAFGEKSENGINWSEDKIRINKTGDGRGKVNGASSNLYKITDKAWKKIYFIEMTIGNYWENDIYKLYGRGFSVGLE